jgi:prepilin-type N-terminal cleavage/methylation domain-containing protein
MIRRGERGFTLVELMLVVAIIGILSSIGGVAWMRYVKKSRTAEAAGHLSKMWSGSIAYFEADHATSAGVLLDKQFPCDSAADSPHEATCCGNSDGRCQGNDPVYQNEPWKSVSFNISDSHLYRPLFRACPDPKKNLILEVWGDLDCDTNLSVFTRRADINASGEIVGYGAPAGLNETE